MFFRRWPISGTIAGPRLVGYNGVRPSRSVCRLPPVAYGGTSLLFQQHALWFLEFS